MIITFGKFVNKTVEEIIIRDPDYIAWALRLETPRGEMQAVCVEARRLIRAFDRKPFTAVCSECKRTATRCSVYRGLNPCLQFWCDDCSLYSAGAGPGKLREIRTYADAIFHVASQRGSRKPDYRAIIRNLAEAKGLPARLSAKSIQTFFRELKTAK